MSEYLHNSHPGNSWEHIREMRQRVAHSLPLVIKMEQALPHQPWLHEGLYERKLDELRALTEEEIRLRHNND